MENCDANNSLPNAFFLDGEPLNMDLLRMERIKAINKGKVNIRLIQSVADENWRHGLGIRHSWDPTSLSHEHKRSLLTQRKFLPAKNLSTTQSVPLISALYSDALPSISLKTGGNPLADYPQVQHRTDFACNNTSRRRFVHNPIDMRYLNELGKRGRLKNNNLMENKTRLFFLNQNGRVANVTSSYADVSGRADYSNRGSKLKKFSDDAKGLEGEFLQRSYSGPLPLKREDTRFLLEDVDALLSKSHMQGQCPPSPDIRQSRAASGTLTASTACFQDKQPMVNQQQKRTGQRKVHRHLMKKGRYILDPITRESYMKCIDWLSNWT